MLSRTFLHTYIYLYHRYNHTYTSEEKINLCQVAHPRIQRMHQECTLLSLEGGLCRFIYWQCLQLSIMKKWLHNYNLMCAFGSVWPLAASIFIGKFKKCPFNFFICQLKWLPSRIIILPYDRHYRYYNGIYGTIVNI